jgi:hypothetical protein
MKKRTAIWIGISALLLTAIGVGIETYLDHREEQQKRAHYTALTPLINIPEGTSTFETADAVREFINSNSIHMVSDDDPEFYAIRENDEAIANKISDFATDKSNDPVHLECSSRSAIMRIILEHLDIRVRTIILYTHRKNLPSHVFLEVQDAKTKEWSIQDPGYDLFWQNNETGERLSAIDIVKSGTDTITPCHTEKDCRWGWHNKGSQGAPRVLKKFFGLAIIKDDHLGTRDLYYNNTLFPIDKLQEISGKGEMKYCELIDKNCRGKIVQLDNKADTIAP